MYILWSFDEDLLNQIPFFSSQYFNYLIFIYDYKMKNIIFAKFINTIL